MVTYATSIGYGVREATTEWPKSAGGLSALSGRYASYLKDWVLLAGGFSILFSGLGAHNVVGRTLYAMGRERVLPAALGRTHRVHKTAQVGIVFNLTLILILAGSQLAGYKKPKSVEFVTDLPKTTIGKVDKKALRAPTGSAATAWSETTKDPAAPTAGQY